MYKNIATRIPEAITKEIAYLAKERQVDTSKIVRELLTSAVKEKIIEIALEKYSKRQVSLGKAAELAKIPLADFMKILVKDFSGASAGGHVPAAGGYFPLRYKEEFRRRLGVPLN